MKTDERTKITMTHLVDGIDWLSEAAAAYKNGNIEEAKAAALIDLAMSARTGPAALRGELEQINANLAAIGIQGGTR